MVRSCACLLGFSKQWQPTGRFAVVCYSLLWFCSGLLACWVDTWHLWLQGRWYCAFAGRGGPLPSKIGRHRRAEPFKLSSLRYSKLGLDWKKHTFYIIIIFSEKMIAFPWFFHGFIGLSSEVLEPDAHHPKMLSWCGGRFSTSHHTIH